jgi:hypothetical protein
MIREQTFKFRRGLRTFASLMGFLSAIPSDEEFQLTIAPIKKERSDPQNNALYGVAYKALGEFTGYTAPELHEVMLRAYFGEVRREVMGKVVITPRRRTTTDENGKKNKLSTLEFAAFYSFIQQKGAEIGCWVPDPDPMFHLHREERAA